MMKKIYIHTGRNYMYYNYIEESFIDKFKNIVESLLKQDNVVGISTNNREPSLITNKSTQNSWVLQAGNNESDAARSNYYDKLKFNSPEEFGEYL